MSRTMLAFGVLAAVMTVASCGSSVFADFGETEITNSLCTGGTTCEGRSSGDPGTPATCVSNPEPCAPVPGTTACTCQRRIKMWMRCVVGSTRVGPAKT